MKDLHGFSKVQGAAELPPSPKLLFLVLAHCDSRTAARWQQQQSNTEHCNTMATPQQQQSNTEHCNTMATMQQQQSKTEHRQQLQAQTLLTQNLHYLLATKAAQI